MSELVYADIADELRELRSAVVSDCLSLLGREPAVMDPSIRPVSPTFRVAGFAATVHVVDVEAKPEQRDDYYQNELALVDSLGPGDLVVISHARRAGFWGELLATSAAARGAVGLVGDCLARDTQQLVEMDFPTFIAGYDPLDSIGRLDVDELGTTIECGGIEVHHGDLVVADRDGIVVVARADVGDLLPLVREKSQREDAMRADLAQGKRIGEAFKEHGVL